MEPDGNPYQTECDRQRKQEGTDLHILTETVVGRGVVVEARRIVRARAVNLTHWSTEAISASVRSTQRDGGNETVRRTYNEVVR
jgi:hypothetical protein